MIFGALLAGMLVFSLPDTTQKEPWSLPPHRVMGYGVLAGGTLSALLGAANFYLYYEKGQTPPDVLRITHRALGYTTVTLALTTSALGYLNYWKLRHRKAGRLKRTVHMLLSSLAAGGYLYAGTLAYRATTQGELERLRTHRNVALLSLGSTVLTVLWILW